jgi:tetratricopeptide (TPR) repeat protein
MLERSPEARATLLACIILIVAIFAAYAHVVDCDFINLDDQSHVLENPLLRGGLTTANLTASFQSFHASLWIPLTWISFMIDVSAFGVNATAMHVENVLWHAANAVLLLLILRQATGRLWASAVVAGLFALHPINVESVAWITERKNVLSTFFAFVSLLFYTRYAQQPTVLKYAGSWICCALSLMAKPMLVTWPFALLLWDAWPLQRLKGSTYRRCLVEKLPFLALSAAICVTTLLAAKNGGHAVSFEQLPLEARISNVLVSYAKYLQQLVWPDELGILYPHPRVVLTTATAVGFAIIAIVSAAAFRVQRTHPQFLVGWLWFLGLLVPTIGLVQVGPQARADRFTYLPQIGLFIAAVWSLSAVLSVRMQKLLTASTAALFIAFLLTTARQVSFWTNGAVLFERTASVTVDNVRAYQAAGFARARLRQYSDAIQHYDRALALAPDSAETWSNRGAALVHLCQPDDAEKSMRRALHLDPKFIEARYNLAALLERKGVTDEAVKHFAEIVAQRPDLPNVRIRLASVFDRIGERQAAIEQLRAAAVLRPNDPEITKGLAKSSSIGAQTE